MNKFLKDKIVRVRSKLYHEDAEQRVIIGKVVEETSKYVVINGRSFCFKTIADCDRNKISVGDVMIRVLPWDNVEIIHWISEKTDFYADYSFDKTGNLVLLDKPRTVVANSQQKEKNV